MALAAGTLWECRTSATASNVNSGGFNHLNANFLTDLTTDASTGNTASPVVSSASYNFVAGDVGAWVFIQSGTNWYPKTWYQIASVASNKATLSASIGAGVTNTNGYFQATTTLGVASVATPTGGVFGIDYSQQDAAKLAITDLVIDAVTNTDVTSVLTPFAPVYVGNIIHTTAGTGFTQGWFEIVSVSVVTARLDRSAGTLGSTGGTSKLGGALSLNSTLDDDFFEVPVANNTIFLKSGSFSLGEAVSVSSGVSYSMTGYTSLRGDSCEDTNRPTIACAALSFSSGSNKNYYNLVFTGTAANVALFSVDHLENISVRNTSTTTGRAAAYIGNQSVVYRCKFVSQNGNAVSMDASSSSVRFDSCSFHNSNNGVSVATGGHHTFLNCIAHNNRTNGILTTSDNFFISNCTFYGRNSKIGTGFNMTSASTGNRVIRSIFSGLTTAISRDTSEDPFTVQTDNNFYNNTSNLSNVSGGPSTNTVDPQFTSVSEISGATATTSGSVLTQSGGDFSSVEDNVDYLHVLSGTGVTTGGYLITNHTGTTLTVNNALGTSSGGDVVYFVPISKNYSIGTNLKSAHTVAINTETESYLDTGAAQREEITSGGGAYASF